MDFSETFALIRSPGRTPRTSRSWTRSSLPKETPGAFSETARNVEVTSPLLPRDSHAVDLSEDRSRALLHGRADEAAVEQPDAEPLLPTLLDRFHDPPGLADLLLGRREDAVGDRHLARMNQQLPREAELAGERHLPFEPLVVGDVEVRRIDRLQTRRPRGHDEQRPRHEEVQPVLPVEAVEVG